MNSGATDFTGRWAGIASSALAGLSTADFRTRWKALADSGVLAGVRDGPRGVVTDTLAAIEGLGIGGTSPGLCYALTSQHFGVQSPLRSARSAAWAALSESVERGDTLMCHALTEEGGGSDPLSMATRAEPANGGWVLTGRKAFVTAAPIADHALVFARTDVERTPFALSAFLVDLSSTGVSRSEPFPKKALTDVPMGAIDFDGVRLGPEQLVGREGAGLALLATTTSWERGLLLGYALGPMRLVLDRTVEWARRRKQFGRPMGASHLVAGRLADMATLLHRSRTLIFAMAQRFDSGEPARRLASEAAMTKVSVSEDLLSFTQHAAALGGVRSFVSDTGLTADLTDAMAAAVYAGPNDLLRVSVARDLGLPVEN